MINLTNLNLIRKITLFSSQVFGVFICIYFIINVQHYQVSWGFAAWILPSSAILFINTLLSKIGTLILVLPLSIILLAWLMPENITLRILSSLFGIASTVILLTSGILKGNLTETYNMRIFFINKILTLDEKKFIFVEEYCRIIEEHYKKNIDLFNYLQQKIIAPYINFYDTHLESLKERLAIKIYAHDVIKDLVHFFELANQTDALTKYSMNYNKLFWIGGAICVTLIGLAFIRAFMETDVLKNGFVIVKDSFSTVLSSLKNIRATQESTAKLANTVQDHTITTVVVATQAVSNAVQIGFENADIRLSTAEQQISRMAIILDKLVQQLTGNNNHP